ncbi:tetratricopeptide repeat protein [Mucilaginibacter sp. FT3.2]|uniref:tetratricopeptide repeat protein n=1 Tax=Mucilaginibacter sp. FT3.2 TaxID=2723090 RepID=UPI0016181959|nr:tetratricopeptide repeat protein [Mucilaginibacter sp. FT3.2]MBB6231805.1 tetratricopeptide (TPR) repeat protein [Mucilaginibacter sp. FT3.2]
MKLFKNISLIIVVLLLSVTVYAQDADVATLIKQGIQLNNAHDNAGALEKYKQALAIDAENAQANYQVGFTLNSLHKGLEGLPYLDKVTKTNTNFTAAAYFLMGVIYDDNHQYTQAIEAYKQAIRIQPTRPDAYFSLGLVYFRTKDYAQAEQAAMEAIKINPQGGGGQRLYALVTFHQNKRGPALLALCTFLMLEPDGARAAEAYTNVQSILKGGILKNEAGKTSAEDVELNKNIMGAVATVSNKSGLSPADFLGAQLKVVFIALGRLAEKQTGNDFFKTAYADFFYKLAQTDNIPAFARYMDMSANKEADKQWLQQNDDKRKALEVWVEGTERKF